MNVLLIESRGSVAFQVSSMLEEAGHLVLEACTPAEAQTFWSGRSLVPVHCILMDINLPTDGLTKSQKIQCAGGILSGWVWLRDAVFSEAPEMRQRAIIYSDYVCGLKQNVKEREYRGIALISKRSGNGSCSVLMPHVRQISRSMECRA